MFTVLVQREMEKSAISFSNKLASGKGAFFGHRGNNEFSLLMLVANSTVQTDIIVVLHKSCNRCSGIFKGKWCLGADTIVFE